MDSTQGRVPRDSERGTKYVCGLPMFRCRVCERPFVDEIEFRAHENECIHAVQERLDMEWQIKQANA